METTARKIAIFDSQLKLVAVACGISQLTKLMKKDSGSIIRALRGERVACGKFYPRYIPDDTIIEMDDLGKLDLLDFDLNWLKEDRLIYATRNQKRSGIILESEFLKIRDSKYKHYTYKAPNYID